MKAQKFSYYKILNIHGTRPLCWCVCVFRHVCSCKIFPGSVSVRYSVPNDASQECMLEVSYFRFCSMLLFHRSTVINCLRRKYSAFIEHAQCMSGYHDACIYVHHCPARYGFNSSDRFRHRLWWIRL
jgi:hypothetical protein